MIRLNIFAINVLENEIINNTFFNIYIGIVNCEFSWRFYSSGMWRRVIGTIVIDVRILVILLISGSSHALRNGANEFLSAIFTFVVRCVSDSVSEICTSRCWTFEIFVKTRAGIAVLFLWVYMTVIFIRGIGHRATLCTQQRPCDVTIPCLSCLCLLPSIKKQTALIPTASCMSEFLCIIGFPSNPGGDEISSLYDKKEGVRSYWMTLRTGEDTLNWRRKL